VKEKPVGQTSIRSIERIFAGEGGTFGASIRKALRYDKKRPYPCPIQIGGINDPCDSIERQQGWLKQYIRLAVKYQQPTRISTKGTVLREPDYLRELEKAPHLFWVTFSCNSPDDELVRKVDKRAPPPSERLATIRVLSSIGCKTAIRLRPMYPGLSDRTPRFKHAYKSLIEMLAEAGGSAVSAEVGFVPMVFTKRQQEAWRRMERNIGVPLKEVYSKLGKSQTCFRPSYRWTENIMHAVRDVTHQCGMTLGVSDPAWKQLTDTGCCCGMLPNDEVFGNWEPENATNQLLIAKLASERGERHLLWDKDIIPPWAHDVLKSQMCNMGAGPKQVYAKRHMTWADHLKAIWNNPKAERSPLNYFQGALKPVEHKDGAVGYEYVGLRRARRARIPYWNV